MTVLALFTDLGLAFSDVMLSLEEPGGHTTLPSTGHTRNLGVELAVTPTKLVRKFFRLSYRGKSGRFLVAGTVSHIKRLIFNIKRVRDFPLDLPESYRSLLAEDDAVSALHVSCLLTEGEGFKEFEILVVIDNRNFARQFDQNRVLDSLPYFGETRVAGGGGADLFRWLYQRGEEYAKRKLGSESTSERSDRTINMVPSLLLEEDTRSTLRTIRNGVGGYYESYFLGKDTIEPLDSVLTIFAAIRGKGKNSSLELRRVFYHRYVSDWLLVLSLFDLPMQVRVGDEVSLPLEQFELFKIPPFWDAEVEPSWTPSRLALELNTPETFRLTLYREVDGKELDSKRFAEGYEGRRLISSKVAGGKVTISVIESSLQYYLERFGSRDPENKVIPIE